ncbi:phosphatidate cytidylyltransferase [Novosphingobium nitrogenifigens DSM 19370]|uniref:Phosphatidate cytidylyltransferase n=1 Tax=Novosphingobium nitrogenifigens DSM 19370 TaxID=983920 RepID=F1ZC83_9SPHN|nr:phosphatidate cytidylyltransferase [Novosphingobium nitrogenifigens]EGD57710.1 phosphatidate cytidylyltransferase [Novosphingobium nitrogenifigens DSM 19370]
MAADPKGAARKSDLPVRAASAAVMVTLAGLAFGLGGLVLAVFMGLIGLGVVVEWASLVRRFVAAPLPRVIWVLAGIGYVEFGLWAGLVRLAPVPGFWPLPWVIGSVIAVDVGAYFAGRTFGGPKIAPAVSPSKTWSGLGGAIVGASAVYGAMAAFFADASGMGPGRALACGLATAVVGQAGDFFESWMKRRAGVKDSGRLIPGHGGLFDRVDGLLAVLFVIGIVSLV